MSMDINDMKLIITGGGTGGHIYPGVAVARELAARGAEHNVVWVGARRGLESTIVPKEGIPYLSLKVTALKGMGFFYRIGSLVNLAKAVAHSVGIISREKPDAVLGVGGYASGPMGLAAIFMRRPLALAEQNASPGFTNRWLAKGASTVFTSWPGSETYFPEGKTVMAGNPVRSEFTDVAHEKTDSRFVALVIGGSQGAAPVNKAMMDAVEKLAPLAERIRIIHQTGEGDLEMVKEAAAKSGLDWETAAYFGDMAQKIAGADLVISRAGAGAVSEICLVGKAAVYIPFPQAADDHQTKNAMPAVHEQAAIMIKQSELTGEKLAEIIIELESDREKAETMGDRARALGRPRAAEMIVDKLLALVKEAA
ncbi:MAG: undecaprenyldiphospho-muramoylpentapeptide beta-N-acetylglucosaminyltransferase [Nitrospinota bacterium]|nr:undecaprenyldiphospho-muramoylpentapeptide beta-N-acetylglucosaminyltransferase [Nitrospinota bacterium]